MTRFICSQDRTEVESVKKELFRAGIRSEIRSNPLAQALRITRLELWLEDERDLFSASKLYSGMQARVAGNGGNHDASSPEGHEKGYIEVDDPEDPPRQPEQPGAGQVEPTPGGEPSRDELAQASALLEKDIEELLERENQLTGTCASLRSKVSELSQALAQAQADLARETEGRAAEVSRLQGALEHERADRARSEEKLEREKRELNKQQKSHEKALQQAQEKLDSTIQQLKTEHAAALEQKDLQKRAFTASLNSLHSRLQAKKAARPEPEK